MLTDAPTLLLILRSRWDPHVQIVFPQVDEMQLDRILAENHFDVEAAAAAIAADLDVINAPPPQEEAAAEQEKPSWLAALFSGFICRLGLCASPLERSEQALLCPVHA